MDQRLLDIRACPRCKGKRHDDKPAAKLICRGERPAFAIRDGIPVMLEEEARGLPADAEVPPA
jgi:uncharacterized protein YbaR (Trm112 family)